MGAHQKLGIKADVHQRDTTYAFEMDNMEDNFYLLINSEQSKNYYTNNTPSHFHVGLNEFINFTDCQYECALVDFSCTTTNFDDKQSLAEVYICFNIASEQLIGGRMCSLVRYTTVKCGRFQMEKFVLPYYVPIKPLKTNMLEVYIKDADGKELSFLRSTTKCTFHFRRRKILWLTT